MLPLRPGQTERWLTRECQPRVLPGHLQGSCYWQAATPLPASRNLKNPASSRRQRPLAVMPAPGTLRDPIHMTSKAGPTSELALRRAPIVRTTIERGELRDNDVPGKPATRKIATCWSCERPIALKPGCSSYHCESCDVQGSDEPALIRAKMTEQTYYFLGRDGQARLECPAFAVARSTRPTRPASPLLGLAACSYPRWLDVERKRDDERRSATGRAIDPDRPAERLDAILQADESRALAGIRSADAIVADRQHQAAVACCERNLHMRRLRMLRRVGQGLRRDVVRRDLDRLRETRVRGDVELDGDLRAAREGSQSPAETALGKDRRVD